MGKVLKADASGGEASVELDLGANIPDYWLTVDVGLFQATLDFIDSDGGSGDLVVVERADRARREHARAGSSGGSGTQWQFSGGASAIVITGDAWQTIEINKKSSGPDNDYYLNATLVDNGTLSYFQGSRYVRLMLDYTGDPSLVAYFKNFKLGTTRGGVDLGSDDFSSGDLAFWTTLNGDVSVVDDPFAAAPDVFTLGAVLSVAFDDPTLEADPTWTQFG